MLDARPGAFTSPGNGETADLHHPQCDFKSEAIPFGRSCWATLPERAMPVA